MKNRVLVSLCLCFTICLSLAFVACDVNYSNYAGEYYLKTVTYSTGVTTSIDELVESGAVAEKEQEYISLSSDQNFSMKGIIGNSEGGYSISSNSITFNWADKTVVSNIDNDIITININGNTYVYQRGK